MVQELVRSQTYSDTKLVCKDGQLLHNRMVIGLIFPALRICSDIFQQEEGFVILLPDFSISEVGS